MPVGRAGERRRQGLENRLVAGAADAEPVRRPRRGGLHRLGDQLGDARRLQPERPLAGAGPGARLVALAGQKNGHLQTRQRRALVRRRADHVARREVVAGDARQKRRAVQLLHRDDRLDRDARRRDRRDHHQNAGRAHRRRPRRLHPARARLGQTHDERAARRLQTGVSARRLRPVRRHQIRARADRRAGARTRTGAGRDRDSAGSSSSSTAPPTRPSGRSSSARSTTSTTSSRRRSSGSASSPTSRPSAGRRRTSRSSPSTSARPQTCPDAKANPAVRDRTVRQAIAYAIDRERINEIAARGTSFAAHGLLPDYYKNLLQNARAGLPVRPRQSERDARGGRLGQRLRRRAREGRDAAVVRPRRPHRVALRRAGGRPRRRDGARDRRRVRRSTR